MELVRRARYAGSWYDDDPVALRAMISDSLANADPGHGEHRPIAAILPHAGLYYASRGIAGCFTRLIDDPPKSFVIIAPSHYHHIPADILVSTRAVRAETPLGPIPLFTCDPDTFAGDLVIDEEAIAIEHAVEMFLPYIAYLGSLQDERAAAGDGVPRSVPKVALLLISSVNTAHSVRKLADGLIAWLGEGSLKGKDRCVIASSDFTHYGARFGYRPFGPATGKAWETVARHVKDLDMMIAAALARGDYEQALSLHQEINPSPTICGFAPALIVSAMTSALGIQGAVEDRYGSYDMTGRQDDSFVTYCRVQWEV